MWSCGYSVDCRVGLIQNNASAGGRTVLEERRKDLFAESEQIEFPGINLELPTIAGLEPVNFITLATPHLGCRGNNHVSMISGDLFFCIEVLSAMVAI